MDMIKEDVIKKDFETWLENRKMDLVEQLITDDKHNELELKISCLIADFFIEEFCSEKMIDEEYAFENLVLPIRLEDIL